MKTFIFTLLLIFNLSGYCQYLGIRARYTETRLVDNTPNAPTRENRLVLSFYHVTISGTYIPVSLTDEVFYIWKEGLQYASLTGGVMDSTGNNYLGYAWTAPKVVAYYNTYHFAAIDCSIALPWRFVANGHELDCGFIPVSHWEPDLTTSIGEKEYFTAPNICLPYYTSPHPYALAPGNVNFNNWDVPPSPPYNTYTFFCPSSPQQLVIRGIVPQETNGTVVLPVRFANESVSVNAECKPVIRWSNLSESSITNYQVERSSDGINFQAVGTVSPVSNSGIRADYQYKDTASGLQTMAYYRIKAVEWSSTHFYSALLRVTLCPKNTVRKFSVYPNPATHGRIVMQMSELPAGKYAVVLVNAAGQEHNVTTIDHLGGSINKLFDLHYKATGTYMLVLRSADLQLSQKIIIKD